MTKIQLRRDTAANWSANNPTPSAGEPCFETDTGKLKIGDGITAYNSLPYQGGGGLEICDIGMALYVDETKGLRRYLNGQIVDINTNTQAFLNRLQEITTLHPSLLCTEEEWQTAKTNSAFGQVGKFVFNYSGADIVSVRLPRVVNVQGLFDLQNLGMTVEAGLPNITGAINGEYGLYGSGGAFNTVKGITRATSTVWNKNTSYVDFDASKSNSIYGKSTTVQPEAIQYPYFIQIATGSETENNIINDIELNNPYSLFDSKYSDHELNNLSWLKSEGQWNAKAVYTGTYDKLLKIHNGTETVEGLSVKLSTETYTDYDFVLNTTDETFRLPLLNGSEDLISDRYDDLELKASGSTYTAPANGWVSIKGTSTSTTSYIHLLILTDNNNEYYGDNPVNTVTNGSIATVLSIKKGDRYQVRYEKLQNLVFKFIYAQGNGSLYFYVGETVQNANLIDAGRIGEVLPTKTDMLQASGAGMPSTKYVDLTLGASGTQYTAPANGWFYFYGETSQANQWVSMFSYDKIAMTGNSPFSGFGVPCYVPVLKNGTVAVYYNIPWGSKSLFRFYYAQGSGGEV